jgi:hypothetical protein
MPAQAGIFLLSLPQLMAFRLSLLHKWLVAQSQKSIALLPIKYPASRQLRAAFAWCGLTCCLSVFPVFFAAREKLFPAPPAG